MTTHAATTLRDMRSVASAQAGAKPRSIFAAMILAPYGAMLREWRIRRDILALEQMDDHQLADIGVSRGHIDNSARSGRVSPMGHIL